MNKNRLLKVAEFLENLQKKEDETKRRVFDFGCVVESDNSNLDMIYENRANKNNIMDCGSLFCACGLLPIIDPESGIYWIYFKNDNGTGKINFDIRDRDGNKGYISVASNYFDISFSEAHNLFTSLLQQKINNWGDAHVCDDDATAKEVADAIRHFVKIKETAYGIK